MNSNSPGCETGKGLSLCDRKNKTLKHHYLGIFSHKKNYQNLPVLKLLYEDSSVVPEGNKIKVSTSVTCPVGVMFDKWRSEIYSGSKGKSFGDVIGFPVLGQDLSEDIRSKSHLRGQNEGWVVGAECP